MSKVNLETIVVKLIGSLVGKTRKFKIVCGNDASDTAAWHVFEKKSWSRKLVGRVCTLEYLIKNDERIVMMWTEHDETFEAQQFGIEVAYAVRKIVSGTHTRK